MATLVKFDRTWTEAKHSRFRSAPRHDNEQANAQEKEPEQRGAGGNDNAAGPGRLKNRQAHMEKKLPNRVRLDYVQEIAQRGGERLNLALYAIGIAAGYMALPYLPSLRAVLTEMVP